MRGALGAAVFTAAVLTGFAWVAVDGLWRPDAFDYAQIARELHEGRGFSSRQAIYALHLVFLRDHGLLDAPWPNLHRFPLPPVAIAAWFRLLGVGDAAVVAYGVAFQAATSALLFALARRAIGREAALASVFLFTANGVMLETGTSGLSEPPVMCFTTAALYALWRGWERPAGAAAAWALASGAALGLAGLARTNALFAAPVLAGAWLVRPGAGAEEAPGPARRLACVGALAAGVALALAPWAVRNLLVAGTPFFSLHGYFLLPSGVDPDALKWDLSVPWVREFTSPLAFAREHAGGVAAKWGRNTAALLAALPTLAGTFLVFPLAFAAVAARLPPRLRALAAVGLAAFAVNATAVGFADFPFDKYSFHLLPVAILAAVGLVWHGLGRIAEGGRRVALLALASLAMCNPPAVARAFEVVPARIDRVDRRDLAFVAARTREDDVVASDQSYAVAWETRRRSVRIHYDRLADGTRVLGVLRLSDAFVPIEGVYLSRDFLRDPGKRRILQATLRRVPRFREVFPRVHRLPGGALYLSR